MPVIKLETYIQAPKEVVFDFSRSVDLHQISTSQTNERVISGVIKGLMNLNDTVTWEGKHFGITQTLSSKITKFEPYTIFIDEMTKGIFKSFKHKHIFESNDSGGSKMIDIFEYTSPLSFLGKFADLLFLKHYMTTFLKKRNSVIKKYAESELWKPILQIKKEYS